MNKFDILFQQARSSGGFEEVTYATDNGVWADISRFYSSVLRNVPKQGNLHFSIDWSQPHARAAQFATFYERTFEERVQLIGQKQHPFGLGGTQATASVVFSDESRHQFPHAGIESLKHLLYEIYLVANLSVPGSFNMYRSYIQAHGHDGVSDPLTREDLELSEYMFEWAWHYAQENEWTRIGFLPFANVHSWYESLQIGYRQVAITGVEKALFCLLHLGRSSFLEPEATFWLAAALEALYKTPHGSSFHHLHSRVAKVLNLNKEHHDLVRRKLRDFYDVRNSFSHGGGDICYPIPNESFDSDVDRLVYKTIDSNNFAMVILLATLQEIIRRNAAGFEFHESVHAHPINAAR